MKLKNKLLISTISVILFICVLGIHNVSHAIPTLEASGDLSETVSYTFDETTGLLTVSGTGTIPGHSFSVKPQIKKVIINPGITVIDYYAFNQCTNMTEISLPEGLETIEDYAFKECGSLKKIDFPESLTKIDSFAFEKAGLTEIVIPKNLKNVKSYAFTECYGVKKIKVLCNNPDMEISLPSTELIKTAGPVGGDYDYEFAWDKKIPQAAFAGLSELNNVAITAIGASAFSGCAKLNVNMPKSLKTIGETAFQGTGISNVNLPNGLEYIAGGAFENCENLTEFNMPDTVTQVGMSVFGGSENLKTVHLSNNLTGTYQMGSVYPGRLYNTFSGCKALESVNLPSGIKFIQEMFSGCVSLKNFTVPKNIETIEYRSFYNCTNLESLTILNPECVIYDDPNTIYANAMIYGFNNSTAKDYAEKYSRNFVSLGNYVDAPAIKTVKLKTTTYTYDGKAKKPAVIVKDVDGNDIDAKFYSVSYKSNTKVGTATATVTFKDKYQGTTKKLTFKINPKGTSLSKLTAAKKAFTLLQNGINKRLKQQDMS